MAVDSAGTLQNGTLRKLDCLVISGIIEMGYRPSEIVQAPPQFPGIEPLCRINFRQRLLALSQGAKRHAEPAVSERKVRIERQGPAEFRYRFLRAIDAREHGSQSDVGPGIVIVEQNSLLS